MSGWKKVWATQVSLGRVKAEDMDAIRQSGAANLLRANADEIERLTALVEVRDRELYDSIEDTYKANKRIAKLEADRKQDCIDFFRWFWNAPGTNAEQGYDAWAALQEKPDPADKSDRRFVYPFTALQGVDDE